jgi:hypothetical protein
LASVARATSAAVGIAGHFDWDCRFDGMNAVIEVISVINELSIAEQTALPLTSNVTVVGAIYISLRWLTCPLTVESGLAIAASLTRSGTLATAINAGIAAAAGTALALAGRLTSSLALRLAISVSRVTLALRLTGRRTFAAASRVAIGVAVEVGVRSAAGLTGTRATGLAGR